MGFFSDIGESLFGDQGEGAQEQQSRENQQAREFIEQQVTQARGDVLPLFDASAQARQQGAQGALSVLGGAIPSQLDVFQRGNLAAQQAILGGQFTPQMLGVDLGFLQGAPAQPLPQQTNPVAQATAPAQALGGLLPAPAAPSQILQQAQEQQKAELLGGFGTDLDLFRAAAAGDIPGISGKDKKFFSNLSRDIAKTNPTATQFVGRPTDRSFIGREGGFNTQNELRVANLLDQFI